MFASIRPASPHRLARPRTSPFHGGNGGSNPPGDAKSWAIIASGPLFLLKVLTGHGVEWFSYREEYLRSIGPFRDAVLAILAAIAKQERVRLSERVLAGLGRAKAQGKVLGRPKAAVRPERVLALRARGLSLRAIAAETGVSVMTVQRIVEAA